MSTGFHLPKEHLWELKVCILFNPVSFFSFFLSLVPNDLNVISKENFLGELAASTKIYQSYRNEQCRPKHLLVTFRKESFHENTSNYSSKIEVKEVFFWRIREQPMTIKNSIKVKVAFNLLTEFLSPVSC